MKYYNMLKKVAAGELPHSLAARVLGFQVKEIESGRVVIEMHATKRLHKPMGTFRQ